MTLARMIQLMVGYVGARFLGAGVGLLSQIVLARLLSQSDVGTVLMGMSAAAFISLFAIGGHSMLASTELPRIVALNRVRHLRAFLGGTLRDATFGLLLLAVCVAFVVSFSHLQPTVKIALAFGLAAAPAAGLMRFNAMVANSNRQFALSYVPDFLVRPGILLAVLLILWFAGFQPSAVAILTAIVAIGIAVTLGQAVMLGRDGLVPLHWRTSQPRYTSLLRRKALALVLVSAVSFAFADIVTLLAGLILPPRDVALVGIAIRLAAIAGFVLQATQLFVLPDFTEAVTKRHEATANTLLWRMTGMTLAIVLAGLVATVFLGEWALHLFGADYASAHVLLLLFMIGQSLRALGGMNQNLLFIAGHQLRTAGACLLALTVLILSALVFCHSLGFIGMGYAVIAAELTWLVALAALASRRVGRRADVLWLLQNARTKAGGQAT